MREKTTKEVGAILENWVLSKVKELDEKARLTRGSGCGNEYSDISCDFAYIECKKRNTRDFTISEEVWNHLNFNLPINTDKFCFMVNENARGTKLVTLSADEFFRLLARIKELEGENDRLRDNVT